MSPAPIGMATISCGHCCHEPSLCEKCLTATLAANGLSPGLEHRLRGLKQLSPSHGGHDASEFSELTKELRALIRESEAVAKGNA